MTPAQCRAARAMLELTQRDLAAAAGVGESTVIDYERQRRQVAEPSVAAIRSALEAAGVQFIDPNGGGAGVRLARPA